MKDGWFKDLIFLEFQKVGGGGNSDRSSSTVVNATTELGIISETVFVCMCEKMEYREMGKVWVVLYNKEEE